jgi:hypothetical protein
MLAGFDPEKERTFYNMTHYDYLFNLEALTLHNKKEDAIQKEAQRNRKGL